jgi:hypothetical protein
VNFSGARDLSRIIFQKARVWLQNSGPRVHFPNVQGPYCKISKLNQNNKLFQQRKSRGPSPQVMDHGRVIVDVSYAAPQAHRIVNVALHQEYSPCIVFIFPQGRKDLYHVQN